jgi:hypothetical protein
VRQQLGVAPVNPADAMRLRDVPQRIAASAIPFIIAPTGSMAANGAITLGTALPNTYGNAFIYLPANAIQTGSAAGWYFARFSSPTVGQVFNNTYASGTPTIPATPTAFVSTGPGAYTGVTTAVTGQQVSVPGNTLGPNGVLRYGVTWSYLSNANIKTLGLSFGGTSLFSTGPTTTSANSIQRVLRNRGVTNAQVSDGATGFAGTGTSVGLPTLAAIDTTTAQTFAVTGQLAVATDYIVMDAVLLEALYG